MNTDDINELINAQSDYIVILGEELEELIVWAANRGWLSSRIEKGIKARERISNAKNALKLNELDDSNEA